MRYQSTVFAICLGWALLATAADVAPPFAAGEVWAGTYSCGGRTTEATLTLKSVDRVDGAERYRLRAQFAFGGGNAPRGSYGMEAEYAADKPELTFAPQGFFNLPPGYVPVALNGRFDAARELYSGRVQHPTCSSFALVRSVKDVAPAQAFTLPAQAPAAPIPTGAVAVAEPALFERFTYRDAAVIAALRLSCAEKVAILNRLANERGMRQGEAIVALAQLESRRECGQRPGSASEIMRRNATDAAVAWRRAQTSVTAYESSLARLGAADDVVARLPQPSQAMPARTVATVACAASNGFYDSDATAAAFVSAREPASLIQVLWYWNHKRIGGALVCTSPAADGYSEETHADWRAIVGAWQDANSHPRTGMLGAEDAAALLAAVEQERATTARREREVEQQRQLEIEKEKQLAEAREKAAEIEFRSYLSKARPAQEVYLRAGRYERSTENMRAVKLYEFIVEAFASTEWAPKANDRLLKLRDDERAAAQRPATAPGSSRVRPNDSRPLPIGPDPLEDLNRQQEELRRQWQREEEGRRQAEAEFVRRQNDQTRRQQEQWEEEERRRRQQPN